MNSDLLNLILSRLPGLESLIVAILFLAYIWNPLKGILQDIPSVFGWRSNNVNRKMQIEDLTLIMEQLKDPSLSDDNRRMLDLRRTELLLSTARGVEFPAYLVNEVINVSTDKHLDGLTWSLIRAVHERIELKQGRLKIEVPLSEKAKAIGNAGLALLFFLYFILIIYAIFVSPVGDFTQEAIIRMIITSGSGVIFGFIFLRDSLQTYHASLASRKLDDIYLRLDPKIQTKSIEDGTATESAPLLPE